MTKKEQEFFRQMRKDVASQVQEHGLKNIKGWKVTEKGIKVELYEEDDYE